MLGSAITALVIVGFLVTGIYVANVSDSNFIQKGEEPVSESFFADLESLSGVDKSSGAAEQAVPAPQENESAITAFFRSLRESQNKKVVKPTTSVLTYRKTYIVPSPSSQPSGSTAPTQSSDSYWFPSANTGPTGSSSSDSGSESSSANGGQSTSSTESGGTEYLPSVPPVTESPPVFESNPTEPIIPPSTPVITPPPAVSLPPVPSWIFDFLSQDWADEDLEGAVGEGE